MPPQISGGDLVLAKLTVDPSGVVKGFAVTKDEFAKAEGAAQRFGTRVNNIGGTTDAVVKKMFNLRTALTHVAGAFGIVGIVFSLTNAISDLVKQVISSTMWFHTASEAVTDWWQAIVHGEDALGKLSRTLGSFTSTSALAELRKLQEQRKLLEETIARGPNAKLPGAFEPVASPVGFLGVAGTALNALFPGKQDTSAPTAVKSAAVDVVELDRKTNALITTLTRLGLSLEDIQTATGATFKAVIGPSLEDLDKAAKDALDKQMEARKKALELAKQDEETFHKLREITLQNAQARNLYNSSIQESLDPHNLAIAQLERIDEILTATREPAEALTNVFHIMNQGAFELNKNLARMQIETALASAKFDILSSAAGAAGQIIGKALFDGSHVLRAAIHDMLRDLARLYVVKAVEQAALGIMASTPWGQAAGLGPPGPYFAAAKLWGVAAGVAIAGAAAVGGGGGGRGGGGDSAGGGSNGAPRQRQANVTIVVNGSLMGSNPDALGREIVRLLRRADSDSVKLP